MFCLQIINGENNNSLINLIFETYKIDEIELTITKLFNDIKNKQIESNDC